MRLAQKPRVIIRHCADYDVERVRTIVREGLAELGLRPHGRTLVKPNLVAAGPLFQYAYTRPEFGEGVLRALQDAASGPGPALEELAVGERCGITIPSRVAFEQSGWEAMLSRQKGIKRYHFEESQQVEIQLTHKERLRDYIFVPEPVAKADFFVNVPKFKAHPWTTVTFSMKAYIGIQDDRHRLIDHDHRLNEKIADLQYVLQPRFIVIDGIVAGEGRMLTPKPFDLKLIVMGDNQVAFDSVCCAIIGVDPLSVEHIRLAAERGFGPTDLSQIALSGDVTLEAAKARARGFQVGLIRVEKYFEGSHITAYAGPPPEPEHSSYCWGGCPGAMEEAIEILRAYDKQCDEKMPRIHVVFGAYEGPIDAKPGEKVVFIGDCATWKGKINGDLVQIESLYQDRGKRDPYYAQHQDIYGKMASVMTKVTSNRKKPYLRLQGCPVSVAEQVLTLVALSDVKNPYFDPAQILTYNKGYLGWRSQQAMQRLRGKSYQIQGLTARGDAAPNMTQPPKDPSAHEAPEIQR